MNRALPPPESTDRILDAAEHVFAERGFAGASLREIVGAAGVNLATVYYHFHSKDGLMAAVLERRFKPLQDQTLARLRELEAGAAGRAVPLAELLEAMLEPPLRLAGRWDGEGAAEGRDAIRLIGRIVNDPDPKTQRLLQRQQRQVRAACLAALRRTLPHLGEPDLQWRFEFFWGALAFVLCNPAKLEAMTEGVCDPADTDALQAQMVTCFAAGWRAPAVRAAGRHRPRPRRDRGRIDPSGVPRADTRRHP